ncbi:MAG: hypothetical protein C5B54_02020 [Acidobacteria bacterium]|nr:MAG: hypothetical protein C5B54_02020 [Acidobacteriota bacterium]
MNEMRRDPVTRKWVVIDKSCSVTEMIAKLQAAVQKDQERINNEPCDFCPGHEESTPNPILELVHGKYEYRQHSPEWQIRVIPNRDPVFRIEGNLNRRFISMYDVMDAIGAHEILIEHREHIDWDEMRAEEVSNILDAFHERLKDLSLDDRFGHLFIFKNHGPNSNSRIAHPYSTIIASPAVPERIRRELSNTRKHFDVKERCMFCDIITEELRRKDDVSGLVRMYDNFVTISPYFAQHPFETWILPRKHNSDFRNVSRDSYSELALALQENLRIVKKVVGPLSYTLLLFTRPNKLWGSDRDYWATIDADYHWHFKFFPRFPRQPGFHRNFSAGSGYMINQIPPEEAARILRNQ